MINSTDLKTRNPKGTEVRNDSAMVCLFTDGDIAVELRQSKDKSGRFHVIYGSHCVTDLKYAEACTEFGACALHSLACAGCLNSEVD